MHGLMPSAATSGLVDLVLRAVHTRPAAFLRELVANASDALDRLRLHSLLSPGTGDAGEPLEIRLTVDARRRTVVVQDNGYGVSRREAVDHLAAPFISGPRAVLDWIEHREPPVGRRDLLGRCALRLGAAFMVAERVTLVTRRADEWTGTRWEFDRGGRIEMADAGDVPRGTSVTVWLPPRDLVTGGDDFADPAVIARMVRRAARDIGYPIVLATAAGADDAAPLVFTPVPPVWLRGLTQRAPGAGAPAFGPAAADDLAVAAEYRDLADLVRQRASGVVRAVRVVARPAAPPARLRGGSRVAGRLARRSILEINTAHPLIARMRDLLAQGHHQVVAACAELLPASAARTAADVADSVRLRSELIALMLEAVGGEEAGDGEVPVAVSGGRRPPGAKRGNRVAAAS